RGSSRCSTAAKKASTSACRIVASSMCEHMFALGGGNAPGPGTFNLRMGKPWSAELELVGAGGEQVDLWRTLSSHGVADLPPNALDEESRTLQTTLPLPRGRARTVRIGAGRPGFARVEAEDVGARDAVVLAGYRGPYLRSLAADVAEGALDLEALNDPELPDEEVAARLLALPGCGPYATAHMMMLLGRYSRLILDSWTRPKYAKLRGRKASDKTIERRFRAYRDYAGLAFWLYLTRDWVEEPV